MTKAPIDRLICVPVPGKPFASTLHEPDGTIFSVPEKIEQAYASGGLKG